MKNILIPRRMDDRAERYKRVTYQKIQQYVKNGSVGDLDLYRSTIESLPDNLIRVVGNLDLNDSHIKSLNNLKDVTGNLLLGSTPIESLGNLKYVGDSLNLMNTPLGKKHKEYKIRKLVMV